MHIKKVVSLVLVFALLTVGFTTGLSVYATDGEDNPLDFGDLSGKAGYKVRFYDGMEPSAMYEEISVTESTLTLTESPLSSSAVNSENGIPVKEGYIFVGWYKTASSAVNATTSGAYDTAIDLTKNVVEENGSKVVSLYAGWIAENTFAKASADTNNYGKTTLDGFSLEGVQIRAKETFDKSHNTEYDGLRFVTVYSNAMLKNLEALSSSAVEYGYALAAKSRVPEQLDDFTINTVNTTPVNCTKKQGEYDHKNFGNYRLSSLVIIYETDEAWEEHRTSDVLARAYVKYTDANGIERVAYDTYTGSAVHGGGCYTSMNNAIDAITNNTKPSIGQN